MSSRMTAEWYRKQARDLYQSDGQLEIDDGAPVSTNDDPTTDHGAYVQAWVWVADPVYATREDYDAEQKR